MANCFSYVFFFSISLAFSDAELTSASCSTVDHEGACLPSLETDRASLREDDEDVLSFLQGLGVASHHSPSPPAALPFGAIPKIVHHVYKVNLETMNLGEWPSRIWEQSFLSWKKFFPEPEYKHFFWDDKDMDTFFEAKCPAHWKAYSGESRDIVRSDLSRYCLLSKIGGIYADLDYEVRRNFYGYLKPGMVNLVQSPYQSESVQNSLMAAPPGLPYWDKLMGIVDARTKQEDNILMAAGPSLLDVLPETSDESMVHILPCDKFQRATHIRNGEEQAAWGKGCPILGFTADDDTLLGIHWGTSIYQRQSDNLDIEYTFDNFRRPKIGMY